MADSDKTQQKVFYVKIAEIKKAVASLEAKAKAAHEAQKKAEAIAEATAREAAAAREAEAAAREAQKKAEATAREANYSNLFTTTAQLLTGAVLVWTLLPGGR